ncbi:2-hydroxyisoflavanone dehydratase-like [Andrographis paniculata]|uniref:2-hydroxyisoflavanone dehydratase-like n=1 Tax=Andrographis paniculata TaxID=175694 RepID=UPI0021E763CF|nr:2-hydroxyisoflavanone dehydratase-like [Andrographis paniculata]
MDAAKEVLTDLSPFIKIYTDGTVERLLSTPYVPPSPDDSAAAVSTKDAVISSSISARLYLPKLTGAAAAQKLPIVVYYHGGGFCIGSAFSLLENRYISILAAEAAALIVAVEYRLAPEHPLPAAYDDAWDAFNWVCSHAAAGGGSQNKDQWICDHGDFSRLFISGESAGANLAHYIALRAGDGGDPLPGNVKIDGVILSHPFFLWGSNPESEKNDFLRFHERLWETFWPAADGGLDNPRVSPAGDGAPSLAGLGCSRILICSSEKDALRDGAIVYEEGVKRSGWKGKIESVHVDGQDHCFHLYDPQTDESMKLIAKFASFISKSK